MTFKEPEAPKVEIPAYSFSLQYTKFPKRLSADVIKHFGDKVRGMKHSYQIGKNKSKCKELYGLGYSLQSRFGNMGFTQYSNHIWIRQVNESDPDKKEMMVCMNCGSLWINDKFIPYTDLEKK